MIGISPVNHGKDDLKITQERFPEYFTDSNVEFQDTIKKLTGSVVASSNFYDWKHIYEQSQCKTLRCFTFFGFPKNLNLGSIMYLLNSYKADDIFISKDGTLKFYFNSNAKKPDFELSHQQDPIIFDKILQSVGSKTIVAEKIYSKISEEQAKFCILMISILIGVTNINITNSELISSDVVKSKKHGNSSFRITLTQIESDIDVIVAYQALFNNVIGDGSYEICEMEWNEKQRSITWKVSESKRNDDDNVKKKFL